MFLFYFYFGNFFSIYLFNPIFCLFQPISIYEWISKQFVPRILIATDHWTNIEIERKMLKYFTKKNTCAIHFFNEFLLSIHKKIRSLFECQGKACCFWIKSMCSATLSLCFSSSSFSSSFISWLIEWSFSMCFQAVWCNAMMYLVQRTHKKT